MGVFDHAAVLLDLDGVLTSTAALHAEAWKTMFDEFLRRWYEEHDEPFVPFSSEDYLRYVDGRRRLDGVAAFLASRHISLPGGGAEADPPPRSIAGLGNRKNALFNERLVAEGVEPLPGAVEFIDAARREDVKPAVVSSSANAETVLEAAGLAGRFDVVVDGVVADRLHLAGKPAPDTFLEAARRLGVEPVEAVVIEDALSGVAAGRAGGFGLVVGVAPAGSEGALLEAGADLVVANLGELLPD